MFRPWAAAPLFPPQTNTYPASRLWALRDADPDSVPLSASLSLWYSGDVEPGLIRTAGTGKRRRERVQRKEQQGVTDFTTVLPDSCSSG